MTQKKKSIIDLRQFTKDELLALAKMLTSITTLLAGHGYKLQIIKKSPLKYATRRLS